MKVLRITKSLDYGGIEKVFELHAKYHDTSYELIFVALSSGGETLKKIESLGFRVIILNSRAVIPSFVLILGLVKLFNKYKPDIVHTCGSEANFHGIIAAKISRVKRIFAEEIGIPSHSRIAKYIFRNIYKFSDGVIAISKAVSDYLIKYEVDANKVSLIYNPVEEQSSEISIPKAKTEPSKLKISFVGRLEPIKNIEILIKLVKYYRSSLGIELWIIGKGSLRERLERLVNDSDLASYVHFKGYVDNPSNLVAKTDVFILPSFYEGFGLACIEAIQSGVPVIVSNSGGMIEFIDDGNNGFTFDPNSLESLINKVDRFINLTLKERVEMASKAKNKVNKMFSPSKYINDLKTLYSKKSV